ncbi:MAG TPA: phage holin family protein [Flavobacterium sp.]|nr:phage holin family protein [Flavobacterium sp.]
MSLKEEIKNNFSEIKSEAKAFLETNLDYYQLLGFKISSRALGLILKIFALALFLSIGLLFLSFAAAFAIGNSLESNTLGFLIVGGIYVVLAFIIYLFRKSLIDIPILKKFSDIFFND